MSIKNKLVAQNPLIMRCHRLMEAFAKSDDERDFYLDRFEGFLIYVDLDKTQDELDELASELKENQERYCPIPKLTYYEVKKVMEGFVNEKVYDIDTKEKLLDVIQSKEARENFLEFIYDHHTELEKWQQYYQERFRVRIIEWLRNNQFDFVFEEDLELTKSMVEKLKMNLFIPKGQKDLLVQRKNLMAKAKTYYSNEALNPRPKRGRPPKQVAKVETEPQFSQDIYTTVPKVVKPFLFAPDYHGSSAIFTFSGKFASEADMLAHRRQQLAGAVNLDMQNLNQKLAALRTLSTSWTLAGKEKGGAVIPSLPHADFAPEVEVDFEETEAMPAKGKLNGSRKLSKKASSVPVTKPSPPKKLDEVAKSKVAPPKKEAKPKMAPLKKAPAKAPVKKPPISKAPISKAIIPKAPAKKAVPPKARLRPLQKKASPKAVPKNKAPASSAKPSSLRLLRRAKKRK
jgi:hypothetical protein